MGDKPLLSNPASTSIKAVFQADAKTRMKNLVERAKSLRRNRDARAARAALEDLYDPNDTKDFQDSPKVLPVKSKLRLKRNTSSSVTSKQNQAKKAHQADSKEVKTKSQRSNSSSSKPSSVPTAQTSDDNDDVIVVEAPKEVVSVVEIPDETSDVAGLQSGAGSESETVVSDHETGGNTAHLVAGSSELGCQANNNVTIKTCQVCQTEVPAVVFDQHISSCLRSNFSKSKGQCYNVRITCILSIICALVKVA